jgi:hypothetical protein
MNLNLNVISLSTVFHRGTLNPDDKTNFSYEGDGLSVSINPDEWDSITRLSGVEHTLCKKSGAFADAYTFDTKSLNKWGVQEKLIQACDLFRYTFYDENQDECTLDLLTYEEVLLEAEDDVEGISKLKGYTPTTKMKTIMGVETNH